MIRVIHLSEINHLFGGITEEAKQETREWVDSWSRAMGLLGYVSGATFGALWAANKRSFSGAAIGTGMGAVTGYAANYLTTNVVLSSIYGV